MENSLCKWRHRFIISWTKSYIINYYLLVELEGKIIKAILPVRARLLERIQQQQQTQQQQLLDPLHQAASLTFQQQQAQFLKEKETNFEEKSNRIVQLSEISIAGISVNVSDDEVIIFVQFIFVEKC